MDPCISSQPLICVDLSMPSTSGIANNANVICDFLETTAASRCSLQLYVAKVMSSQTWRISHTLQCSKDVIALLSATSSKSLSLQNTLTAAVTLSPKVINSPGGILSQERIKSMHLCSLGKNFLSCAGASECLMWDVCDVTWPCGADLGLCVVAVLRRKHHHVRSAAALRVRVCAHRGHLLHLADPDGAADGGSDHSDVALAHDRGRAPELGLLRRLARLPARVHRWANGRKLKETLAFSIWQDIRKVAGEWTDKLPVTQKRKCQHSGRFPVDLRVSCICPQNTADQPGSFPQIKTET